MNQLNIDIETRSGDDLIKGGLYRYVQSPDFNILLFGYSLNGAPAQVVDFAAGELLPDEILSLLFNENCEKYAFNAAFEWFCLSRYFGLADDARDKWLNQWVDTQLQAQYCGYPAGLAKAGAAMGLADDKKKLSIGSNLIRKFSVPQKPNKLHPLPWWINPLDAPEYWELFKQYCAQDVETEREIGRILAPWPVPYDLQKQWETDARINARGIAVNERLVFGALEMHAAATAALQQEAIALSGIDNPKSVKQVQEWLQDELGQEIKTLRKDDVTELLSSDLQSCAARRLLEIRQEISKSSVKKYDAIARTLCADGRVRGTLRFYGANRTGRWAGAFVQVQNLPRTHLNALDAARTLVEGGKQNLTAVSGIYGNVPNTLSMLIRTALVPREGCVFIDCDFSAIEARVIAWLAGEEWVLEVFRTHGKIYEATASQMFGVPLERIAKGNPEYDLRQRGKVATLALGYQGGTGALIAMGALKQGIKEEDLPDIVSRWRKANPHIVQLWYDVDAAVKQTLQTGQTHAVRGLTFRLEGNAADNQLFLTVQLPSFRKLFYVNPHMGVNRFGKPSFMYQGLGTDSKQWGDIESHGGKLVENIVQAIARDCLAESIERLERAGFKVVFHVHDEVVIEYSCSADAAEPTAAYEYIKLLMGEPVAWAPDLPLRAEGWIGPYYTKD